MRHPWRIGLGLLTLTTLGPAARAQASVEVPLEVTSPSLALELLDPRGQSRFHLISRASFDDGEKTFSQTSIWSFEARANIRIRPGLSLSATLPFGLWVPKPGQEKKFLLGNLSLGLAGGFRLLLGTATDRPAPRLFFGGAFEVYAPTAPHPDDDPRMLMAEASIARSRAYEPQLYLSDRLWFRGRGLIGLEIWRVNAEAEIGIVPGIVLAKSSKLEMYVSAAGRLRVVLWPEVEPFIEAGTALAIKNIEENTPFMLTPGIRFHLSNTFDPAIFASFSLSDGPSRILFGVDLAGALRVSRSDGADARSTDEFLGGF